MPSIATSGGVRIELDRKFYAEFKRQLRAASSNLSDHSAEFKAMVSEALDPLAEGWRVELPGSLKATVKKHPASLSVWAGHRAVHGDLPFLPWLEFGGTVVIGHRGRDRYPVPARQPHGSGDWSRRIVMFSNRDHDEEGRYRKRAILLRLQKSTTKVADAVQQMLDRVFT